ncbi:diacylglycerol kinase family protein, partial [Escherichia coli]|uniref:diacylglycerol kinase family protein n=1 Tax=Escherichia coli TaxID=562 RepID=UPI0035200916
MVLFNEYHHTFESGVGAGGGDGTINEVSTALIQCEGDDIPALGILPLGTANDFA